ncbi:MAG: ATP-binding protein [Candidatus Gastranaerophilales bacterium]|nr:ATP-binding protein [Candidatus Gastranaerophilales bacterium]
MKRLKITQQLLIVLFIAVIIPLCLASLIVTNVNQQAVRKELRYSAGITADSVYQHLINCVDNRKSSVMLTAKSISYIKSKEKIDKFISDVKDSSTDIKEISIINKAEISTKSGMNNSNIKISDDITKNNLVFYAKIRETKYLKVVTGLNEIKNEIFRYLFNETRQVYILDSNNKIIMSYNKGRNFINKLIPYFPKESRIGKPFDFGPIKNQPNVLIRLKNPDWKIIVVTPRQLTNYGIINARFKIIGVLIGAAILILLGGLWYTFSLNTNIKQLLKAISALEKGNYSRRIRLLKDPLTPYEIIFLANEFNQMAQNVDETYNNLQNANYQLSKLDQMKSNLIDTVSHEFRTPLTCIKGYTARLLRSDISIDEEIKINSLKVIKQQAERLSRLVEDLLVIPEIESSHLRIVPDVINLKEIIETCIFSIHQKKERLISFSLGENFPNIYADPDRVEQIIINLLDNAVKYSPDNSEININVNQENNEAIIKIRNEYENIPEIILNTLFEKFTRLDENLTRTTRGTGLGLFIAKGLTEAMGGKITLSSKEGFEVRVTLPLATAESTYLEAESPT